MVEQIDTETPFRVEFARRSKSRGYGPTLVPVADGGANVKAKILVLNPNVTIEAATNMLYRREKHNYDPTLTYEPKEDPDQDDIVIQRLDGFGTLETVLYTRIGANIAGPSGRVLAEMAVNSVSAPRTAPDGITYLIDAKRCGIVTPLSADYEQAILEQTKSDTLETARDSVRQKPE